MQENADGLSTPYYKNVSSEDLCYNIALGVHYLLEKSNTQAQPSAVVPSAGTPSSFTRRAPIKVERVPAVNTAAAFLYPVAGWSGRTVRLRSPAR